MLNAVWPRPSPNAGHWAFLVVLVGGGMPLVFTTLRGIARGRLAADIVAALAILTALVFGEYFAGAVVVLMMWFYITALAILLGAEVNAELLHLRRRELADAAPAHFSVPEKIQPQRESA